VLLLACGDSSVGAGTASAPPDATGATAAPLLVSASASASARPVASVVASSELELVRGGDIAAMKRLELVPLMERSAEQSLALTDGRAELARLDGRRLLADLTEDPKLRRDPATLAYAARLLLDAAAAPELLAGLTAIGDPLLLDFVHDLGARGDPGARLPLLIRDLLRSKSARAHADRALSVLLDLEDAEPCWQFANLLVRAAADADARASVRLSRLEREAGCGPKKADDCMPCLREPANAAALTKAIDAAKSRPFDAVWLLK
jgi:hypothetical protein